MTPGVPPAEGAGGRLPPDPRGYLDKDEGR
jgi:hypothetical protein